MLFGSSSSSDARRERADRFIHSPLQHPRTTSNVSFPYPSNRWFGSIFTEHLYHEYSFRMSPSPMIINLNTSLAGTASGNGYLLGYPSLSYSANEVSNNYNPQFFARLSGIKRPSNTQISATGGLLDGYSDWSAAFIVRDSIESTKWIKTTIGKGFVFTYNEFSEDLDPIIIDPNGMVISAFKSNGDSFSGAYTGDRILVRKTAPDANGRAIYYAVYAPANTSFSASGFF